MTYKFVLQQKEELNEALSRIGAPFRIAFMSQNNHTRITIELGTPEQIEKGLLLHNILCYASLNQTCSFLAGFKTCLNTLDYYNYSEFNGILND